MFLVAQFIGLYVVNQYTPKIINGENIVVKQESELIYGTPEYIVSLVLDNLLNIERLEND